MNKLGRDIKSGSIVVCEDGTFWEVVGGNGLKHTNMGGRIFGYPVDPDTGTRFPDAELASIEADICPVQTADRDNAEVG